MKKLTLLDAVMNAKQQPTIESFQYCSHDTGAAATAAKQIAGGKIVSFDKWELVELDLFTIAAGQLTGKTERRFIETVFIGLAYLEEGICLRISRSADLDAVGSHSLIPTWNPAEQVKDPVFIAAEITAYFHSQRYQSKCNFFLNK